MLMGLLATLAAGAGSFFVAMLAAFKIHDVFKDRWTARRIDLVSASLCCALLGLPAYAMASFDGFSFAHAGTLHLVVGLLFAVIVLVGILNWCEGFVLATVVCILLSLIALKARHVREHNHAAYFCASIEATPKA